MKLLSLAILLSVVAACVAQQKCCAPDQFMGVNGATIGVATPKGGEAYLLNQYGAWDFKNKRFGFDQGVFFYSNNTYSAYRLIQNYAQKVQWFILEEYKYCEKMPIPFAMPDNCVPANSTHWPGGYLGGEKTGVFMDSYLHSVSPPTDPVLGQITYNVVQETCFPIGASFVGKTYQGKTGLDTVFTSGWLNVTIGIPEPDKWFKLPAYCSEEVADVKSRRTQFVPDVPFFTQFHGLY